MRQPSSCSFQHVTVAHFSERTECQLFQRQLQPHVAHQGADRAAAQLALTQPSRAMMYRI